MDAGVDGSGEGSRAMFGTLGHHDDWRYADQTITIESGDDTTNKESEFPLLIGGGAATLLGGYALLRNRGDSPSSDSTETDR